MRLRGTTAILSVLAVVALVAFAGCGGGGGDGNQPPPGNADPQIESLSAPDTAFPGSSVPVSVNASDPDGDSLSYEWSATGGTIEGSGSSVVWRAPVTSAAFTITVTVTDGRGGQAQGSVTITVEDVGPPPPPRFND